MRRGILAIALLAVALISLLTFSNLCQLSMINSLQNSNEEYQCRLDRAVTEFNYLKGENEKLKNQIGNVIDVSANIVTRLGAKLFAGGVKDIYGTISNYIWMTGEVQNTGNVTAFVSLSIKVSTTKDVEIHEVTLGTLQPNQIANVIKTIWPEQGDITSWTITPVGYHFSQ
jgi:hypothetical protein